MKILLLSPLSPCSGNATTICRIRGHFDKHGHRCELSSPEGFTGPADFIEYLQYGCFHLILAIHAYKSGILLIGCKVPYILVLGGTDVNQCSADPAKLAVMTEAISGARHIVCFGENLKERFFEKWPHYKQENVTLIPQAVDTNPKWAKTKTFSCYLLIIGPKMEDEYFRYFADKISSVSHVLYIPGLSLEDTHAVIRDSFALVNTSLSEGMAISILEAMHLRTPVIVRDIPGNRNIVRHGETGLIFNTVQEFFTEADRLLTDKFEVTKLTENAYKYVVKNHSKDREERDYIKIAQNCL